MPSQSWYAENRQLALAQQAVYRSHNRDKKRAQVAAWRKANPELVRLQNARAYASKRPEMLVRRAAYHAAHPEQARVDSQNRRARKMASGGKLSRDIVGKLRRLQRNQCACCSADLGRVKAHMDHVVPLARDGAHADSNMQLLCRTCNLSKHARDPVEFMQSRGFLL